MPDKTGRLTPQERVFVERYAATGDRVYAASEAGYSKRSLHQSAAKNIGNPALQPYLRLQVQERVNGIVPKLLKRLSEAVDDKATSVKDLVAIGKLVMPIFKDGEAAERREPHEMTADEIHARIQELEREAAARAKPVVAVEAPAGADQPVAVVDLAAEASVFD